MTMAAVSFIVRFIRSSWPLIQVGRLGQALFIIPLIAELAERLAAYLYILGQVAELNTVVSEHFLCLVGGLGKTRRRKSTAIAWVTGGCN